jgi:ribosome-associated toxin RatA of RatAB toxin-antitoxin module
MFELINDVESYPQFVPGCTHARVETRSPKEIVATLWVRQGLLHAQFTTRNELEPDRRIHMRLVRGPFRMLEGDWELTPDHEGCRVELTLKFAFSSRLASALFESLFQQTVESLVDAFVSRAKAV